MASTLDDPTVYPEAEMPGLHPDLSVSALAVAM
ncbi:hypothetical protein J2X67_005205 [Variovorax sp. 3319]|nr:hypothetical protein [Variovorax sp. 3319]